MAKIIKSCLVVEKKVNKNSNVGTKQVHALATEYEDTESLTQETADALYIETKMMLEELISQAQCKADEIILKAKEEAQRILEQANRDKNSAYQEGYEQGVKKGLTETAEEMKDKYEALLSLFKDFKLQKEEYLIKQEKDIVELVVTLTEKIIGTIVDLQPEVIRHIIKNTLEHVNGAQRITIKVNPIHIPYLSGYHEIFIKNGQDNMQIIEDSNIKPGNCRIITENGFVDSLLDVQLRELKQALLEVVDHAGV